MFNERIFRSKALALGVAATFLLLILPARSSSQSAPATGSLAGFLYEENLETPVENAVVKIRNIKDQKEYSSQPTDENGLYRITDIEEGRYVLGVSADKGNFNFDYVISIKAAEMAKLSLALKPGVAAAPAKAGAASGGLGGFFTSTTGILILIAVGGILIYATYKILTKEEEASPARKR